MSMAGPPKMVSPSSFKDILLNCMQFLFFPRIAARGVVERFVTFVTAPIIFFSLEANTSVDP